MTFLSKGEAMTSTYSIAHLAAMAYLRERGMKGDSIVRYVCEEGSADIVTKAGDVTVLMSVSARRQRGEASEPEFSRKRLQRIATCFLVEHPEVGALRFDVVEALIGAGATVTVNVAEGAYSWER